MNQEVEMAINMMSFSSQSDLGVAELKFQNQLLVFRITQEDFVVKYC